MKRIMSGLIVLAMVFTLVSISEAGGFPGNLFSNDKDTAISSDLHPMCWAGYCPDMNKYREMERRDADRPRLTTPEPMGSTGF